MFEKTEDRYLLRASVVLITFAFFSLMPFLLSGQIRWDYTIYHLKMPTTKLTFSLEDSVEIDSLEYFDLKVTARNQSVFKLLFRVDNEYHALIQKKSFLPLQISKQIQQKNIREHTTIRYDQSQNVAFKDSSFNWQIPDSCHNYFSMLFFLREKPLAPGDTYSYYLDVEYLIWQVAAHVEAFEKLKIQNQDFYAVRLKLDYTPVGEHRKRPWKTDLLTNRIAKKGGSMAIWFSTELPRLILRVDYDSETKMYLNLAD